MYPPRGWAKCLEVSKIIRKVIIQTRSTPPPSTYTSLIAHQRIVCSQSRFDLKHPVTNLYSNVSWNVQYKYSLHESTNRYSICHEQIRSTDRIIAENQKKLSSLISKDSYAHLTEFLKHRTKAVQNNISARHEKKLHNRLNERAPVIPSEPKKWVVNLSSKPLSLSSTEQSLLEKGPKFAPTPSQFPYKISLRNRSGDY